MKALDREGYRTIPDLGQAISHICDMKELVQTRDCKMAAHRLNKPRRCVSFGISKTQISWQCLKIGKFFQNLEFYSLWKGGGEGKERNQQIRQQENYTEPDSNSPETEQGLSDMTRCPTGLGTSLVYVNSLLELEYAAPRLYYL